jgi:hypothetical protein
MVLVAEGRVNVAVFGFHIDFNLGMIWAEVALTAGLRLSGLHDRKTMTGVAAGATPLATIQVHAADADIRPRFRVQLTVFDSQYRPMACVAARGTLKIAVHAVVEPGVNPPNNLHGIGVFALTVFFGLIRMASGTVFWGDGSGNRHPIFSRAIRSIRSLILFVMLLTHVGIEGLGPMTIKAADIGAGVPTMNPVRENGRTLLLMTLNAR